MEDALLGLQKYHLENTAPNFAAYLAAGKLEGDSLGEELDS